MPRSLLWAIMASENSEANVHERSLPWDRFSNWMHCVCVVTFDLEIGQAMEVIYPNAAVLTEQEKISICYLAFPDSNSGCMGDTQFHFRMRCTSRPSVDPEASYYYGFVYFRQVKDIQLPRGYFQKSVVIISQLPLISFFMSVVEIIAPEFFDHGQSSLESACMEIDRWSEPVANLPTTLSLFGNDLHVELPCPPGQLLSAVCDIDVFHCFSSLLPHVQLLWELVLLGEPLVVMASQPQICSDLVQALVSMISPIRYCADYRPYFTIHDSEFKEYTSRSQSPPSVILGVTNPFFAKTLQHWPHIIKTCDGGFSGQKLRRAGNLRMLDSRPGVYTQYKPFLHKDKTIQNKLLKGMQTKRPANVQTVLLKRYLLELTQSFMIPLERYMASCMPLQKHISPFKEAPSPRPFDPSDFLATLDAAGPQLTSGVKGDWPGLYRRFFHSPNFLGWYNARYQDLSETLNSLHLQSLSRADMTEWVEGRPEVEVVDMVLRLRGKLSQTETVVPNDTADMLRSRLEDLMSTLPDDLKSLLKNS